MASLLTGASSSVTHGVPVRLCQYAPLLFRKHVIVAFPVELHDAGKEEPDGIQLPNQMVAAALRVPVPVLMPLHSREEAVDLLYDMGSHPLAFDEVRMGEQYACEVMDQRICFGEPEGHVRSFGFISQQQPQQIIEVPGWPDLFRWRYEQAVVVRCRVTEQTYAVQQRIGGVLESTVLKE